jgi:hypothetical protein
MLRPIFDRMDEFVDAWAAAWAEFGSDDAGRAIYANLLETVRRDVVELGSKQATLQNDWPLNAMFESLIFQMALGAPAPSASLRGTRAGYSQAAIG